MSGCHNPKVQDVDEVIFGDCRTLEGGVIKPMAPIFVPVVENVNTDRLWRDENLVLVTTDDDQLLEIDNA